MSRMKHHLSTRYYGAITTTVDGRLMNLVNVDGKPFTPPAGDCGFSWGYKGAGPQCLAWSILFHATGEQSIANRFYHWFADAVVSQWGETWSITVAEVAEWITQGMIAEGTKPTAIVKGGGA